MTVLDTMGFRAARTFFELESIRAGFIAMAGRLIVASQQYMFIGR